MLFLGKNIQRKTDANIVSILRFVRFIRPPRLSPSDLSILFQLDHFGLSGTDFFNSRLFLFLKT